VSVPDGVGSWLCASIQLQPQHFFQNFHKTAESQIQIFGNHHPFFLAPTLECFADMPEQTQGKDWQLTLGQIEVDLKRPDISESELNSINRRLSSDDLLQIEKVLFQDKSMFFVKADINKWGAYSDEGTKCKKALWVHAFL